MPVHISAHFQEVTSNAPAFQMIIRDVSRQWRVPAELVSAMLAMSSTELQTGSENQSVQDVAKRLSIAWNRAPIIGNGNLEDGIGIFESWYFALGRAGTGKDGPSANTYADKVLGILAAGNHPFQVKINVTRIRPDQLTWGRNVYGPPAPWHFTGIPRRSKGTPVVDIPLPLMQQVWDAPDGFDGMKAYVGKRKLIVLNKTKNPESDDIVRKRFTALHELAHHALTFPDGIIHKEEEKLCHIFASAVLYPEDMARKELHKDRFHFYEKELVIIKERWGISFAAIFQRANRLGILNDYVLKKFQIGFKKRNYHLPNAEPGRYRSRENPTRMERLVYLGLAKEAITINEAAFFAGTTAWKLREQMIQLV